MKKKFLKISFYSFITFCVINFTSLIYSIIFNKLQGNFPRFSFGLPFEIYHQFEVKSFENCYELQHGTNPKNFIYNFILSSLVVISYFILISTKFKIFKK